MGSGQPDFTQATLIKAVDANGNLVTLLADASGRLIAMMYGHYDGSPTVLATDSDGQLIVVPRGQGGNYLAVDSDGYLTTVMKGIQNGTLRTLVVDDAGNLVTVIKGDYDGDLKTVAVDDVGRLSAFIIDSNDAWDRLLSIGNSELAVRLGSPVSYDRRGLVFDIITFASGLGQVVSYSEAGADKFELDPALYMSDGYSLKLSPDGAEGSKVGATLERGYNPGSVWGFEVGFTTDDLAYYLDLWIDHYVVPHIQRARVRYDGAAEKLQYWDSNGAWADFATGIKVTESDEVWNRFKLVHDVGTGKYVRAMFNGVEYDLSEYSSQSTSTVTEPRIRMQVVIECSSGVTQTVWVDNLIVTTAEPL